jgi:L-serine deaminase
MSLTHERVTLGETGVSLSMAAIEFSLRCSLITL